MSASVAFRFDDPTSDAATSVFSRQTSRALPIPSPRVDDYTITSTEIISFDELRQRVQIVEAPELGADLLAEATNSINALLSLNVGWDGYNGRPTTEAAARKAVSILSNLISDATYLPDIVPTVEGGVHLEWHKAGWDVEIEVHPDGSITAFIDNGEFTQTWVNHQLPQHQRFIEALQAVIYAA